MTYSIVSVCKMLSLASVPVGVSTKIIAIDGCGGAGKSTLAAQISEALGSCPVIHTDDFASWDNPLGWYDRMINQVLKPLKQNKTAVFQRFDLVLFYCLLTPSIPPSNEMSLIYENFFVTLFAERFLLKLKLPFLIDRMVLNKTQAKAWVFLF